MLERMRASERFLGVIKAARVAGHRDVLDTHDYVGPASQAAEEAVPVSRW